MGKKYWKSQGILSVRKSGNPDDGKSSILIKKSKIIRVNEPDEKHALFLLL